jgi:hypothetical protein
MNRLTAAACILSMAFATATAAVPTHIEATIDKPTVTYGTTSSLAAVMTYAGPPCPASLPAVSGTLVLEREGVEVSRIENFYLAFYRSCRDGTYTAGRDFTLPQDAPFGTHGYTVRFLGNAELEPSASAPASSTVLPALSFSVPVDGLLKAGVADTTNYGFSGWHCGTRNLSASPAPAAPPPGVQFAYGIVKADLQSCFYDCGFICPVGTPNIPQQRLLIEAPQDIAGKGIWVYSTGLGQSSPAWHPVTAEVRGRQATFLLNGPANPLDQIIAGTISAYVAIATTPAPSTALQDLWWSGIGENGWGASIAQSGDPLFGGLYVYREDGAPVWAMLSGGTWNAAHTAFTGPLYTPLGSSFTNYDASALQVGSPIGAATLTFSGTTSATMDVTVGAATMRKSLQRFVLSNGAPGPYGGMWWGGAAQNGWGLFLQQQGDRLFAVWYTYDTNRQPVWFVVSDATVMTSDNPAAYGSASGTLYRTTSAPWFGAAYDPSRYAAQAAGTMRLEFYGPDAGRLTYTVDGVPGAKTIYRFPF